MIDIPRVNILRIIKKGTKKLTLFKASTDCDAVFCIIFTTYCLTNCKA